METNWRLVLVLVIAAAAVLVGIFLLNSAIESSSLAIRAKAAANPPIVTKMGRDEKAFVLVCTSQSEKRIDLCRDTYKRIMELSE